MQLCVGTRVREVIELDLELHLQLELVCNFSFFILPKT